jgi:hypothetical protein
MILNNKGFQKKACQLASWLAGSYSNCFKHLKPILYADDTNLFYQSKNLLLDILLDILNALDYWCKCNKLTINLEKTNYIIIKNHQNPFCLPNRLLKISNTTIEEAINIGFLEIIIDSNLFQH